jgi:hypothetical protein
MPDSADAAETPVREWEEAFLPEIPVEEKRRYKKAFEDLVGLKWLTGNTRHPIRDLWVRKDHPGLVEVLSVGNAFERMRGRMSPKIQRKLLESIVGNDSNNRAGFVFELMAMAMFDTPNHPVEVPGADQSGFDFSVRVKPDHVVRVSCKVLTSSLAEKNFLEASELLARRIRPKVDAGLPLLVIASLASNAKSHYLDSQKVGHALIENYQDWLKKGAWEPKNYQSQYSFQDWNFTLAHLNPLIPHHFHSTGGSYTLLAISPHQTDEQRRFTSKFVEAAENLKKHCSDVGENQSNIVALKIPSSISLSLARVYLEKELPNFSHISAVFLYRVQLLADGNNSGTLICHESAIVSNSSSIIRLEKILKSDFNFDLNSFIGISSTNIERKIMLGGVEYDIIDKYVNQRGHHFYSIIDDNPMEFKVFPGIQVNAVIDLQDGSLAISPKDTLENSLVLL